MIRYKIYIKAILFIVLIAGLFGFANYRNSARKIADIQVEFEEGDNLFITSQMVNKLLTQSSVKLKNKPKESIILRDLEYDISKNKMIENAEVYTTVGGVLKIKVIQRKPITRIRVNNKAYYLDRQGKKMPLSDNYSARVPITTGVLSDTDLNQVYKFCNQVLNDDFMQKLVVGIHISKNEFELKTRMGNQVILFGDLNKVNSKIKKLKVFYQKAIKDNSFKKYSKINLKYNNQVVCTKAT